MSHPRALAALLGVALIWGSTWLVIKEGLDAMPPFLFAGVRFALAAVMMLGIVVWRRLPLPTDAASWVSMGWMAVLNAGCYGCVFWGEQYVDSYIASIIGATSPFFSAILANLFLRGPQINGANALGLVLSFAGVAAISVRQIGEDEAWKGIVVMLGNAVFVGMYSVFAKARTQHIDTTVNVTAQMLGTAVLLGLLGLVTEPVERFVWTGTGIFAIGYLAAIGSVVAFLLWTYSMKRLSVVEVSMQQFISPGIAILLGIWIRHEPLNGWTVLGCALILGGVYLVNVYRPRISGLALAVVREETVENEA